jgi:hypothetical protein
MVLLCVTHGCPNLDPYAGLKEYQGSRKRQGQECLGREKSKDIHAADKRETEVRDQKEGKDGGEERSCRK